MVSKLFVGICLLIAVSGGLFLSKNAFAKEPDWAAEKYSQISAILMEPGATTTARLGFLNKGRYNWRRLGSNFVSIYTYKPKYRSSVFYHESWLSTSQPAKLKTPLVGPNRLGYAEFILQAPKKPGRYKETFSLAAENRAWIPGGEVELVIIVREANKNGVESAADGAEYEEEVISVEPPFGLAAGTITLADGEEPHFRVGLYTTEKPVIFSSPYTYELRDTNYNLLGVIEPEERVELSHDAAKKIYQARWAEETAASEAALRLVPVDLSPTHFVLHDFFNRLRWDKNQNDNKFRDTLELRHSEKSKFLWVINELPLEDYLKGLIEVPEKSPIEFKKAVLTAARTYAYYHLTHPTKHENEGFILDADYDQVYRGYGAELRSPGNTAAVEETRGLVVTYKDEVVPTPYFARSDGRTRSFKEVWGTHKPWLVSVKTSYDRGWRKFGHGVGMSQRDARLRAQKGANFEEILKYYYKGIEIKRVYETGSLELVSDIVQS